MFWLSNKKNNFAVRNFIWRPGYVQVGSHFFIRYTDSRVGISKDASLFIDILKTDSIH